MNIERTQETAPTQQTWTGVHNRFRWTLTVGHDRPVDGYSHGHRRIIEALNYELGTIGGHTRHGLHQVTPTTTRMSVTRERRNDPYTFAYYAPRSSATTTLVTARWYESDARARILIDVLRADGVSAAALRSRGIEPINPEDWR